jgi:glycosyltransferase involved in cell wall biosynthesis
VTVSVLVPVYNGGRTLPAAIESILAQTHSDFELIVIDDSSTDNSRDVIRDYALRDQRVLPVYHDRNAGLASTLNEGLHLARGELVARMDQDDESMPQRLATQLEYMASHPRVAVAGSFAFHMGRRLQYDRLVEFPTGPEQIRTALATYNCLYHPSTIMRRSAILDLGGYRAAFKNAEDYDLWLRASTVHDLENIPEPLIRYRFSVNGMTLGRKWEQLYYTYLAQAANSADGRSFEAAEAEAERRLAETDRRAFFTHVTRGTLQELVGLRRLGEALAVAWRFGAEVGRRRAGSILIRATAARLRSAF